MCLSGCFQNVALRQSSWPLVVISGEGGCSLRTRPSLKSNVMVRPFPPLDPLPANYPLSAAAPVSPPHPARRPCMCTRPAADVTPRHWRGACGQGSGGGGGGEAKPKASNSHEDITELCNFSPIETASCSARKRVSTSPCS